MPVVSPQQSYRASLCPASLRSASGQGMLEYILIVVFVVIASVAVWKSFGGKVKNLIESAGSSVEKIQITCPDESVVTPPAKCQ